MELKQKLYVLVYGISMLLLTCENIEIYKMLFIDTLNYDLLHFNFIARHNHKKEAWIMWTQ